MNSLAVVQVETPLDSSFGVRADLNEYQTGRMLIKTYPLTRKDEGKMDPVPLKPIETGRRNYVYRVLLN